MLFGTIFPLTAISLQNPTSGKREDNNRRVFQISWIKESEIELLHLEVGADGTGSWLYQSPVKYVGGKVPIDLLRFDAMALKLLEHIELDDPLKDAPQVLVSDPRSNCRIAAIQHSKIGYGFLTKINEFLFSDEFGQVQLCDNIWKSRSIGKVCHLYSLISKPGGDVEERPPK